MFEETLLPPINMKATSVEIHQWKSTESIKNCYQKLFQPIFKKDVSYITQIIERVWSDASECPAIQIAYAITICQILLDPNNNNIKISESIAKPKLQENLVSFAILYK